MSLINRPFRGFSGTYTRPELPLDHPEIALSIPNDLAQVPTQDSHSTSASKKPFSDENNKVLHVIIKRPERPEGPSNPWEEPKPPPQTTAPPRPSHQLIHRLSSAIHTKTHHAEKKKAPQDVPSDDSAKSRVSGILHAKHLHLKHHKPAPKGEANPAAKKKNDHECEVIIREFTEQEKVEFEKEIDALYMKTYTKNQRRMFYREGKKWEEMQRLKAECAVCDDDDDESDSVVFTMCMDQDQNGEATASSSSSTQTKSPESSSLKTASGDSALSS